MPRTKKLANKTDDKSKKKAIADQKVARKTAPVTTGVKKRRWRPGTVAMREIKRYQKSTEMLIQRSIFVRKVRGIIRDLDKQDDANFTRRIQANALLALQEATESAIVSLFEDSYLCTMHARRLTLFQSDVALARRIRGDR